MKSVFIADCDAPVQRALSRLFTKTPLEKAVEANDDSDQVSVTAPECFTVSGSQTRTPRTPTQTLFPTGVVNAVYQGSEPACPWLNSLVARYQADRATQLQKLMLEADIVVFDVMIDWEQAQLAIECK